MKNEKLYNGVKWLRPISGDTAEAEMMVHMNGPEIGEADNVLKTALDLHFEGNPWHLILAGKIIKTHGKAVTEILS